MTIRWARLKLWSISLQEFVSHYVPRFRERGGVRGRVGRGGEEMGNTVPWRVKVIDCSSFSSSSVRVRLRWEEVLGRDIVAD